MSIKETMMVTIMALVILLALPLLATSPARADDKSITPQEFATAISEVPGKVSNFVASEVEKTKQFQKENWANTKVQFADLKLKITEFFSGFQSKGN